MKVEFHDYRNVMVVEPEGKDEIVDLLYWLNRWSECRATLKFKVCNKTVHAHCDYLETEERPGEPE